MLIDHRYRPVGPTLARFHDSDAFVRLVMGPFGSGKTVASCNEMFRRLCEMPPGPGGVRRSRWAAIRNTYPDLRSTTIKDWRDVVGEELGRIVFESPINHTLRFALDDGTRVDAEVLFLAMDREEDVRKLRGLQLTGAWLNEAKELHWGIVDRVLGRVGRYPKRQDVPGGYWYGVIGDYNAPSDDNWMYLKTEVEKPVGWELFRQPGGLVKVNGRWVENPAAENLHNLPPGYYLRQAEGRAEDTIKADLANEYTAVKWGKPVYEADYNDALHAADELRPIAGVPLLLGWDWGRTPACVIEQLTPQGRLITLREIVGENIGVKRFVKDLVKPVLRAEFAGFEIAASIGDPAGRAKERDDKSLFEELEEQGIRTQPAPTNAPAKRQEAVRHYLATLVGGQPAYQVSKRGAPTLRHGFVRGYAYPEFTLAATGDKCIGENPMKNRYSHIHDAHQYVCVYLQEGYATADDAWSAAERFAPASAVGGY